MRLDDAIDLIGDLLTALATGLNRIGIVLTVVEQKSKIDQSQFSEQTPLE